MFKYLCDKVVELLDDEDKDVRAVVAKLLKKIAEVNSELVKPAIPKLINFLMDPEPYIVRNAAKALRMIAKENPKAVKPAVPKIGAEEALEPLKKLLDDITVVKHSKGSTVKDFAKEAIEKIQKKTQSQE